jgi:hypothetical protein
MILARHGPGSLHRETSFFVHFRADLDNWRNAPGNLEPLGGIQHNGIVTFTLAPDSNGFVASSGSHTADGVNTTWDNGPTQILQMTYDGVPPVNYIHGYGTIDLGVNTVYLNATAGGLHHVIEKTVPENQIQLDDDVPFMDSTQSVIPVIQMTIDPNTWNIAEGELPPVVDGDVTWTLTWEEIVCETGGPLLPVYAR